ncbi:ABC transporter permease [Nocardiopsis sp. ARC36]
MAALREQMGLNRPAVLRFLDWITGAVRGDFGVSLVSGEPVSATLWLHLRNTMLIAVATIAVAVTSSIVLGVVAGLYRDRWPDTVISTLTLIGMSVPEFVVATLLVLALSITVPVLPAVVLDEASAPVADLLPAVVLPTIALSVVMTAYIVRMTRTSVIDVMESEFVTTARLKGLGTGRVVVRHALPSALLPTLNVIAMNVAWLVGGMAVVENVFNYPGVGRMLLEAVHNRDLPVLQAIAVVSAAVYVLCNLAADLGAMALNPRLRTGERSAR